MPTTRKERQRKTNTFLEDVKIDLAHLIQGIKDLKSIVAGLLPLPPPPPLEYCTRGCASLDIVDGANDNLEHELYNGWEYMSDAGTESRMLFLSQQLIESQNSTIGLLHGKLEVVTDLLAANTWHTFHAANELMERMEVVEHACRVESGCRSEQDSDDEVGHAMIDDGTSVEGEEQCSEDDPIQDAYLGLDGMNQNAVTRDDHTDPNKIRIYLKVPSEHVDRARKNEFLKYDEFSHQWFMEARDTKDMACWGRLSALSDWIPEKTIADAELVKLQGMRRGCRKDMRIYPFPCYACERGCPICCTNLETFLKDRPEIMNPIE